MGSRAYLISKVLQALLTLAFVLAFNFFLFRILPGNPAAALLRNPRIPASAVHQLERDFGLDKSLPEQFVIYVKETFQGNLGISYRFREQVTKSISRFSRSMMMDAGSSFWSRLTPRISACPPGG